MERQFIALGDQYDVWYNAGKVGAEAHDRIVKIFYSANIALDAYKVAVLAGEPTDELYMELNRLKTQIIFEMEKL
jgi:hypothetical protein